MSARYAKSFLVLIVGTLWMGTPACGGPAPGTSIFDAGPSSDATTVPGNDSSLVLPSDDSSSFVIPSNDDSSTPPDGTTQTGTGGSCEGGACADSMPTVCGDGVIESGEQCDDGNSTPGDGCSGVCQIEPGFACPTPGKPCVSTVSQVCGDGKIEGDEACDDGNTVDGDGCSAACQVEPGFSCATPGKPCVMTVVAKCGDGTVNNGEQCDDGNTTAGDGCSATCQIEQGWTCPTPNMPCQKLQYCGDGIVQTALGETCDDGNAVPGDGCSGVCTIEPGYACTDPGMPCVKIWVCGNGHVDPGEACDDGNTVSGDGCSSDCSMVEAGFTCPDVDGSGGPCVAAPPNTCGDGIVAGNTLYVAGTEGTDASDKLVAGGIGPETTAALENIQKVLKAAGFELKDVVSVTVYLADIHEFPDMNKVYKSVMPDPKPTRATVQVAALVNNARIEISAIAVKQK